MPDKTIDIRTVCAHGGVRLSEETGTNEPFVPPITQSTLFRLGTSEQAEKLFSGELPGYTYTRFGNPTVDKLASTIARLEKGAGAMITASGNAATLCAVLMSLRGGNDRVLAIQDLYGGSLEVLTILTQSFGLPVEIVDPQQTSAWHSALGQASVVFVETPSNPLLRLVDLADVVRRAKSAGATVIVDNTVATPYNQQPLQFGADVVVHSTSKFLNGHSDMIGGCIVTARPLTARERSIHKNLGGTVNAFDAWLVHRGLRTFALRMEAHNRNARQLAEHLQAHPQIAAVYYPGLASHPQADLVRRQMRGPGGLLAFEVARGESAARRFLDRVRVVTHAVSLGGLESLATRPAATSHRGMSAEMRAAAGVTDSLIRLSVGVEAIEDLISDVDQALSA